VFGTDLGMPHLTGGPVSTVNRRPSIIVEAFEHDITFYKRSRDGNATFVFE
jgi:hypothetical protein